MHQIILTVGNILFDLEGIEVCSVLISKDFNDDIRISEDGKGQALENVRSKKFSGPLRAYPKSPAALNVIHVHAKCSIAR
jgi:hypothetical protein